MAWAPLVVKEGPLELRGHQRPAKHGWGNKVLWEWRYVHDAVGIKVPPWKFLGKALPDLARMCEEHVVPTVQIAYSSGRTKQLDGPREHCLGSAAMLLLLVVVATTRQMAAASKQRATTVLLVLSSLAVGASAAMTAIHAEQLPGVTLQLLGGNAWATPLQVTHHGLVLGFATYTEQSPRLLEVWHALTHKPWNGVHLQSPVDRPMLRDLLILVAYLMVHEPFLWRSFGHSLCSGIVHWTAQALEMVAMSRVTETPPPIRCLRGPVRPRRVDPVNRLEVVRELGRRSASTGGSSSRSVVAHVKCFMYMRQLECRLQGCTQLAMSWDPSTHSGLDLWVGTVYSWEANVAGYCPVMVLRKPSAAEILDSALEEAVKQGKAKRMSAYAALKALCRVLARLGLTLDTFKPQGFHSKPLTKEEVRVRCGETGKWLIVNTATQTAVPQITGNLGDQPVLVHCVDQGSVGAACLNFLVQGRGLAMLMIPDRFHRAWNDTRAAMKKAKTWPWRSVVELCHVFNLNYGPFSSGAFFETKKELLEQFVATCSPDTEPFLSYAADLAKERGLAEPETAEQRQQLYDQVLQSSSFHTKGPLVKLMRWFSWLESATMYRNQLWSIKMILEKTVHVQQDCEGTLEEEPVLPVAVSSNDPKAELQMLKKSFGGLALAPRLITRANLFNLELILTLCQPTWKVYGHLAKHVRSAQESVDFWRNTAAGTWQDELVAMVNAGCRDPAAFERLGLVDEEVTVQSKDDRAADVFDFMLQLLHHRARSLVQTAQDPPFRYANVLSPDQATAAAAVQNMQADYQALLSAEAACCNAPGHCRAVQAITWRASSLQRAIFLSFEQDNWSPTSTSGTRLLRACMTGPSDSKVVEDIHQHLRDLERSNRNNRMSRAALQLAVVGSGVLESRKIRTISVDDWSVANTPATAVEGGGKKGSWTKLTSASQQKVPEAYYDLLRPGRDWGSPTPAAAFTSVAAAEWTLTFWKKELAKEKVKLSDAAVTQFVGTGWVLRETNTGQAETLGLCVEAHKMVECLHYCNKQLMLSPGLPGHCGQRVGDAYLGPGLCRRRLARGHP